MPILCSVVNWSKPKIIKLNQEVTRKLRGPRV